MEYRVITAGTHANRVGRCTRYVTEGIREVVFPAAYASERSGDCVTLSVHQTRLATPDEAKACRAAFKAAKEAHDNFRGSRPRIAREMSPDQWRGRR
jgi:hypothetical protein